MSKIKTEKHQLFYEGLYWCSREKYAEWVIADRNTSIKDLRYAKKFQEGA